MTIRKRRLWHYWQALLKFVFGCLVLSGCQAAPIQTDAYHLQEAVLVVTNDLELIKRACYGAKEYAEGTIVGCYVPGPTPVIYCPPDDAGICWQEVFEHHVKKEKH